MSTNRQYINTYRVCLFCRCDFVGARHSLSEHVALCSYNSLKGSSEGESRLDKIKQENKSAREDIDFLFTSLRGLNQRFEQMEAEKDKMEAEHESMALLCLFIILSLIDIMFLL